MAGLLILQRVALVNLVGLVLLLHVDLQVAEIAGLLNLLKVHLCILLQEILLGAGQVVGKLELLFVSIQH